MPTCLLCGLRPANQTGSHIFTLSLIKSAINQVGRNERGKEVTFGISSEDFLSVFFGKDVTPEKWEEILNKEVSDDDIAENENPFTIDHIVCTSCEKRFTTVENYFLQTIQNPLNSGEDLFANTKKHGKYTTWSLETSLMTRVFFYIQIWRASVSKYGGFQLDNHTEEKIRKIINYVLVSDRNQTIQNCLRISNQITQFPIIITHCETEADEMSKTENVVYVDQYKEPHFLILNDFYVQFYCQAKHLRRTPKPFFSLNDILGLRKAVNYNENGLIINEISNDDRKRLLSVFYRFTAELVGRNYIRDFIAKFVETYGHFPPPQVLNNAVNTLISKYKVGD